MPSPNWYYPWCPACEAFHAAAADCADWPASCWRTLYDAVIETWRIVLQRVSGRRPDVYVEGCPHRDVADVFAPDLGGEG